MIARKDLCTWFEAKIMHSDYGCKGWDNEYLLEYFKDYFANVEVVSVEWFDNYFIITCKEYIKNPVTVY